MKKAKSDLNKVCEEDIVKNGYLHVKIPSFMRNSFSQWKAWTTKWIEISIEDTDRNVVILSVYRNDKAVTNFIYQIKFDSQNAVIFRCSSRTQQYSFTISNNSLPAVHLAGNSESQSQSWMRALRNLLWTPNPVIELDSSKGNQFYVSIIDNEYSHKNGLIGAYGYLQITPINILLTHPQSGDTIQEWCQSVNYLRNSTCDSVFELVSHKLSSEEINSVIKFYCIDANRVIREFNQKSQLNKNIKITDDQLLKERLLDICSSCEVCSAKLTSDYIENSSQLNLKSNPTVNLENKTLNNFWRLRTCSEIPETVLNCSFSNNFAVYMPNDQIHESDEFDINGDIENIYEEIVVKDCDQYNHNTLLSNVDTTLSELRSKPDFNKIIKNCENSDELIFGDILDENETCDCDDLCEQINELKLKDQNISNHLKSLLSSSNGYKNQDYNHNVNDYCVMRPIFTSDSNDYVDMKSLI